MIAARPRVLQPRTLPDIAEHTWLILTAIADQAPKGTAPIVSYGEVWKKLGYGSKVGNNMGKALGLISRFCRYNGFPLLNAIVVSQGDGVPGDEGEMTDNGDGVEVEQRASASFNWYGKMHMPTAETFRVILDLKQNEEGERKVPTRKAPLRKAAPKPAAARGSRAMVKRNADGEISRLKLR